MAERADDDTNVHTPNDAIAEKERLHRQSYTLDPIQPDEFEDWSEAQAWDDDDIDNKENEV